MTEKSVDETITEWVAHAHIHDQPDAELAKEFNRQHKAADVSLRAEDFKAWKLKHKHTGAG